MHAVPARMDILAKKYGVNMAVLRQIGLPHLPHEQNRDM